MVTEDLDRPLYGLAEVGREERWLVFAALSLESR